MRLRLPVLVFVALMTLGVGSLTPRAADVPPVKAAASAVSPSAPSASVPPPASTFPVSPCAGPGASGPGCTTSNALRLQWLFAAVALPPARFGVAYGPQPLVEGGQGPYTFEVVDGRLPPGLTISPDGKLSGVPTLVGSFPLTLAVRDASSPSQKTQQAYRMQVLPPRLPTAAAPKGAPPKTVAPRPPATFDSVTSDDAGKLVAEVQPGTVQTFLFTTGDLDKFAPVPAADPSAATPDVAASDPPLVPAGAASAPAPAPAATVEQLREMLAPLVNVEYPTRELFDAALSQAHCSYYQALATAAARKRGINDATVNCPPQPAPLPAKGKSTTRPADDSIPLDQLYARLLPADYRAEILGLAQKPPHVITNAKPVLWFGDAEPGLLPWRACRCAPPPSAGETYAFYPFWLANGTAQPMDFGLFRRIGYLGAIPDDSGGFVTPHGWDKADEGFPRIAQRYGTAVDLVLYRRDWSSLLQRPPAQRERIAQLAAINAVKLVDAEPDDLASTLRGLLLPFWREPSRLYGGITVYFDDPSTKSADKDAFRSLYRTFVLALIAEMQRTGKQYALNLVVPERRLGEDGVFGFDDLADYLDRAQPATSDGPASETGQTDRKASLQIQLRFVVPLEEPTSVRKKALREKLDDGEQVKGTRRREFLESLVPVLFLPGGDKPATLLPESATRLNHDLVYFWWNFGNVALWTPPMPDAGPGRDVGEELARVFESRSAGVHDALCRLVCPNRVPLRLLLQALVAIGVVSIGLYAVACSVRRLGRPYLYFLFIGGGITLLVAAALLSCDPTLETVRTGNDLLYILIALLFVGGAYALLSRRVSPP